MPRTEVESLAKGESRQRTAAGADLSTFNSEPDYRRNWQAERLALPRRLAPRHPRYHSQRHGEGSAALYRAGPSRLSSWLGVGVSDKHHLEGSKG